jgi:hypothetical protein
MTTTIRKSRIRRLPKVGDRVVPIGKGGHPDYPNGTVGKVVGVLQGCCGPIVAVRFPHLPGRTVDLFWKKVKAV